MKRQTIDQEGARRGEVSAASLQLDDNDTIAIRRIATMSVETHMFFPWDTPETRQSQSVYATLCVTALFFGLLGLAVWALWGDSPTAIIGLLVGCGLMLLGLLLGIRAAMIAFKLKEKHPFYKLIIGTSDARQIALVDNNREVLIKIRDVIRHKMDTGDTGITGDFDLNLDVVNLRMPGGAKMARPAAPAPLPPGLDEEDEDRLPGGAAAEAAASTPSS
jgi:hypothetical protein